MNLKTLPLSSPLLFCISACLTCLRAEVAPPVRHEVEQRGFVHLFRQLDVISPERIHQAIETDLKEYGPDRKVVRLSYFADGEDLLRTATGKVTVAGYAIWKKQFMAYQPVLPAAEVFLFGPTVNVRIRKSAADSEQEMMARQFTWKMNKLTPPDGMAGPAPGALVFSAEGADCELLDLVLTEGGGVKAFFKVGKGGKPGSYSLYAKALAGILGSRLGVSEAEVVVRNDCWFIGDQEFPIAYRFLPLAKLKEPPSEKAYLASETGYGAWESGRKPVAGVAAQTVMAAKRARQSKSPAR